MKITFVVPTLNLSGGLRVVSIYAELLAKKGHEVTVVTPNEKKPNLREKIKSVLSWKGYKFESGFNTSFFNNVSYKLIVLDKHRPVQAEDVPVGDVIIATFWYTAEWLRDFPDSKGKKVYFIQHYETHPWLPIERVKNTLRFDFTQIVVAEWIAKVLEQDFGKQGIHIVPNAVNHQVFHAPKRSLNSTVTFGMMFSIRAFKGSAIALSCFMKVKDIYPNIKLIAFGVEDKEEFFRYGVDAEYHQQPSQDKIREIYNRCDAWLFTSSFEGFGLPILEAMACRTPVIGTNCGAAPELLASNAGILIDVDKEQQLCDAMIQFCNMSADEWEDISHSAFIKASKYEWESSVSQIEKIFRDITTNN